MRSSIEWCAAPHSCCTVPMAPDNQTRNLNWPHNLQHASRVTPLAPTVDAPIHGEAHGIVAEVLQLVVQLLGGGLALGNQSVHILVGNVGGLRGEDPLCAVPHLQYDQCKG